ncbi:MAG TPA: purine-nucleoside phosphorylase [Oscillospiraceae bacterium]|nr:purine-nucleoside phosphorylase [Oscillospiraceae bacterium]HNW04642.1 purine-nucleoside phosphorylase [Oscillospiraceae bacterium]HPV99657.1 purine-nucleoside phosphorylase [Oscillospiraceae bacterium]
MTYNQIKSSAAYLLSQTGLRPKIGLILGSGLHPVTADLENAVKIPYKSIPRWNAASAPGHEGALYIGTMEGVPVAVMSGRLHYYEGNSIADCAYPVAVLKAMGIEKLIVTNAAGGVNTDYHPGEFVLIRDQIKFFDESPLRGEKAEDFGGEHFFDMSDTYTAKLREAVKTVWQKTSGEALAEGVYAFMSGPQFETPAEIRALRVLGADLVGMSTAPEAIMAAACGLTLLGVSVVTNMAAGVVAGKAISGGEVNETGAAIADDFRRLLHVAVQTLSEIG